MVFNNLYTKCKIAADAYRKGGVVLFLYKLARQGRLALIQKFILYNVWGFNEGSNFQIRLVWIDPEQVIYRINIFPKREIYGVGSGNWDRDRTPYQDGSVYQSLVNKFENNTSWEKTIRGRQIIDRIEKGESSWTSISEYENHIEDLYTTIKREGYRLQTELDEELSTERDIAGISVPDEVRIAVGRNNELMQFPHESHRMALAKLLNIKRIPALIMAEHERSDREFDVIRVIEP